MRAFAFGADTACLGLLLHYLHRLLCRRRFHSFSDILRPHLPPLTQATRSRAEDVIYFVLLSAFMNGVVLPLSAVFPARISPRQVSISGVLALMLLVGLARSR